MIALVGPNGAGKSTLLQLAVGLLAPTAGTVRVLGRRPMENPAVLAAVGFVAQDVPLYDSFTVAELITFGAKLNPRFDAELARRRLAGTELDLRSRAGRLSRGQRAQVALALALAKRPRLLVLDEPVASLDPLARREFLQALMEAVAEEGLTVALSSHLIADLERVCDYLLVLSASRVQVLGDIDELLATHRLVSGPAPGADGVAAEHEVVAGSGAGRQATLLVRTNGGAFGLPRDWTASELTLDELVLAYMRNPETALLPGPRPLPVPA